jgi:hypothetical protein
MSEVSRHRRAGVVTPGVRSLGAAGLPYRAGLNGATRRAVQIAPAPASRVASAHTSEHRRSSTPCHDGAWLGLLLLDAAGPNPDRPAPSEHGAIAHIASSRVRWRPAPIVVIPIRAVLPTTAETSPAGDDAIQLAGRRLHHAGGCAIRIVACVGVRCSCPNQYLQGRDGQRLLANNCSREILNSPSQPRSASLEQLFAAAGRTSRRFTWRNSPAAPSAARNSSSTASARCRRALLRPSWPTLSNEFTSGDGLGIHQPGSTVPVTPRRQGRARDRVICPAVTRSSFLATAHRSKAHEGNRPRRALEGMKLARVGSLLGEEQQRPESSVDAGCTFARRAA